MKAKQTPSAVGELLAALAEVIGERPEGANILKDVQVIQHSLFQSEARRLGRKLGEDHPRTRQMQARVQANLDVVQEIEVALETGRIRVPEVEEDDVLIHGRVVDEKRRGLSGLTVSVEDRNGRPVSSVGRVDTDASGYYAFTVDPATAAKLAKAQREGVFLAVRTDTGELVHRQSEPLRLAKGGRVILDVELGETRGRARSSRQPTGKQSPRAVEREPSTLE